MEKLKVEKGIESLKTSVMRDCADAENCFSENGCTKVRYRNFPEDNPRLIEMGFTTKCISQTKCTHDYCGKYKWILERANLYAEKSGKTVEEVLTIWETDRTYWYMNYYQECNQPLIKSDKIIEYDSWVKELNLRFGDTKNWAFKCPACNNIQSVQDFIDNNIQDGQNKVYHDCIGRYVENKGCKWTLGGLFKLNTISVLKDAKVYPVFEMAEKQNTLE